MNNIVSKELGLAVAFCAPSGAGKSYISMAVTNALPGFFENEVVATTRRPRKGLVEPNRQFMTNFEFNEAVNQAKVVLPHRPFGLPDSPIYGFLSQVKDNHSTTLAEVHATLLEPFRELVSRPILIVGLTVPDEVLNENLCTRQEEQDGASKNIRLGRAQHERELIMGAANNGVIDLVVPYSPENRLGSEALVIDCVRGLMQRIGYDDC